MSEATFRMGTVAGRLLRSMVGTRAGAESVALEDIQGNVLGGFYKPHQKLLWISVEDPAALRTWLRAISQRIASAEETLQFKKLFRAVTARRGRARSPVEAVWTNVALSPTACKRLSLPVEFDGELGEALFGADDGRILLQVAADDVNWLDDEISSLLSTLSGGRVMLVDHGVARSGEHVGAEHFGFQDGMSQPFVHGVDVRAPGAAEDAGDAWIHPGDIVLGYRSSRHEARAGAHQALRNGTFMAYWKLRQDVRLFKEFLTAAAGELSATTGDTWTSARVASVVMGRGFDGAVTADSAVGNPHGCPSASHVHKASPRRTGQENWDPLHHKILRRGIAYGGAQDDDRGLLFICYQSSLARQFETILKRWMAASDFPTAGSGADLFMAPLVKGSDPSLSIPLRLRDGRTMSFKLRVDRPFVESVYGGYFFVPSISALASL